VPAREAVRDISGREGAPVPVVSCRGMHAELERIEIPLVRNPDLDIAVPGSKSLTNRAFVVAALAEGATRLEGALVAEDTEVMRRSLESLGFMVSEVSTPAGANRAETNGVPAPTLEIAGLGGKVPAREAKLDLKLSGTSMRFLAALVSLGEGRFELDGNERMRERPIGDLLAALNDLGVNARSAAGNDCPPVVIESTGMRGGTTRVAGDRSSQFLSGLLLAAPYARTETFLEVTGSLQSKPFVDMTLDIMAAFGVSVEREGYRRFRVPGGRYRGRNYLIEGDAMAAGYFWAAAAVTGGRVRVTNVGSRSSQGDRRLAGVLEEMGCDVTWGEHWCEVAGPKAGSLRGGSFDLNDMPDQAQTLAVIALFADSPVEIRNVWNLRIKETDRLWALATELRKFGATVVEREDGLLVTPPERPSAALVDTYGDHRMAMSFAVAGLRVAGTTISDPDCVAKTYPGFWADLRLLTASGPAL
jgi:3-phosphoshikimate 1-carboxyvinyltransferase